MRFFLRFYLCSLICFSNDYLISFSYQTYWVVYTLCYLHCFATFYVIRRGMWNSLLRLKKTIRCEVPEQGYLISCKWYLFVLSTVRWFQHLIIAAPVEEIKEVTLIRTATAWITSHIRWELCLISVILDSWPVY